MGNLKIIGIMVAVLMAGVLSEAIAQEQRKLVICRASDHPTHFRASENLDQLYGSLGIAVTYLDLPTKRALFETQAGNCGAEVGRIKLPPDFHNLIQMDEPIHHVRAHAYTLKEDLHISSWEDLKGFRVAAIRGELYAEKFLKGYSPRFVNTYAELLELLKSRKIDVIVGLDDAMMAYQLPSGTQMSQIPLFEAPLYHILHLKNRDLHDILKAQIKKLSFRHTDS